LLPGAFGRQYAMGGVCAARVTSASIEQNDPDSAFPLDRADWDSFLWT
jgi:hypothetical protein